MATDLESLLGGGGRFTPINNPAGLIHEDAVDDMDFSNGAIPLNSYSVTTDDGFGFDSVSPLSGSSGSVSPNGTIDTGWSTRTGNIVGSYGVNSELAFPSLGGNGKDYDRLGRQHLKKLEALHKAHIARVATTDPNKAGGMLADLESMKSGYDDMLASGEWDNALEAASAVSVAGAAFNGFGNLAKNTSFLKRFAAGRGVKIAEAGREIGLHRDAFGKAFMTAAGFQNSVGSDSSVYESISNDFSDFLDGLRSIEDKYNWQFDTRTYEDVARKAGEAAGKMFASGGQLRDIGGREAALYALMSNGSLNPGGDNGTMENNRLARLMTLTSQDRRRFVSPTGNDSVSNPNSAGAGAARQSFGVYSSLAANLFDHRMRMLRAGMDPNDFSDTTMLNQEISNTLRSFSTGTASVRSEDINRVADGIAALVHRGGPDEIDVLKVARDVAKGLPPERANALSAWARSMVVDDPETQRTIDVCVAPFITQAMAGASLSASDPTIRALSARLYQVARRRILDKRAAAAADGVPINEDDLRQELQNEFTTYSAKITGIRNAKMELISSQVQARQSAQ